MYLSLLVINEGNFQIAASQNFKIIAFKCWECEITATRVFSFYFYFLLVTNVELMAARWSLASIVK